MNRQIGATIAEKRKALGLTQQWLARELGISFQAVSKWENGSSAPDLSLLPRLADLLGTSVDVLVGHLSAPQTIYEKKYQTPDFYWGIEPNELCYEILKLRPSLHPLRVLDMGCGEGKDAVFLARNGYCVSAFDLSDSGLAKGRELARCCRTEVDFFKADLLEYQPTTEFDVVFSSGVLHYLPQQRRAALFNQLKQHTAPGGIHVLNVFIRKPFLAPAPDMEEQERNADPWYSGELFEYYHDWRFHLQQEKIFDCTSGGEPHQHCMASMIAEKMA